MIPFPRDPDFVGRKELLDQIHEKAETVGAKIAVVGIGGIGLERRHPETMFYAYSLTEKRKSLLSTVTRFDSSLPIRGSFGYTPAM